MPGLQGIRRTVPRPREISLFFILPLLIAAFGALPAASPAHAQAIDEAGASEATPTLEGELAEARQQIERGRLFQAEQAARRAILAEPDSAEAHALLGRILLRREKNAEAIESFTTALRLDPQRQGIARLLGAAKLAQEDWVGARDAFAQALVEEPDDPELRMRLGLAQLRSGEADLAIESFEAAARDPEWRQLGLYNAAVARAVAGRTDEARAAFEEAIAADPSNPLARRAQQRVDALQPAPRTAEDAVAPGSEPEPPTDLTGPDLSVYAGAGLFFDSNVTRLELDDVSGEPDGGAELEAGVGYDRTLATWPSGSFGVEAGYDFAQTLYFEATEFDLQGHTFRGRLVSELGELETGLGYVYSLSTLDGSRFLDFHELSVSMATLPTDWWYASLTPAVRAKRFDDGPDRDAEQVSLGTLNLFPLDGWKRYLLIGVDAAYEDAAAFRFDYWSVGTLVSIKWPFELSGRKIVVDVRHRFQWRDYLGGASGVPVGSGQEPDPRNDATHSARIRIEVPVWRGISMRARYEFRDTDSNLGSVDSTSHVTGLELRAAF